MEKGIRYVYNEFNMAAKSKSSRIEPLVKQEEVLLTWQARSRPFKKFPKEFYVNLGAVAVLLGLILFVIEGMIPAILVASLYFIFYVFTNYEPGKTEYRLTTYGVKVGPHRVDWPMLGRYWFDKRFDSEVLIFETYEAPWRLELVIDSSKRKQIDDLVSNFAFVKDTPPNYMDKATDWVSSRLRL